MIQVVGIRSCPCGSGWIQGASLEEETGKKECARMLVFCDSSVLALNITNNCEANSGCF